MTFTVLSIIAFALSVFSCLGVRKWALERGVVDDPSSDPSRKIHKVPVALLGGVGIYIAFALTIILAMLFGVLPSGSILIKHLLGLIIGGAWLILGGYLDDKYDLPPKYQIIWPVLAVLTVIISGIGIRSISNPAGGQIFLDEFEFVFVWFHGIPYRITLLADLFTFAWLMGVMYSIKFFDGLDGLVSGITIIGSFVVFFTSLLPHINQPTTALLALIVASVFAGFLLLNFNPAKQFLGEGGSTLAGFLVGSLAIIAESKVITTLVVLALPILDLIWVLVRRLMLKQSVTKGDKKHIHHRLLQLGYSHRTVVFLLWGWTILLGLVAFFIQRTFQFSL